MNELKVGHQPLCWISCLLLSACVTTPRHDFQAGVETGIDLYLLMILVYVRASHFCAQFFFFFFFSRFLLSLLPQILAPGEKKELNQGSKIDQPLSIGLFSKEGIDFTLICTISITREMLEQLLITAKRLFKSSMCFSSTG